MSLPYRDSSGLATGYACSSWRKMERGSSIMARDAASGTARDMFRGGEREARTRTDGTGRTYHDDNCARKGVRVLIGLPRTVLMSVECTPRHSIPRRHDTTPAICV